MEHFDSSRKIHNLYQGLKLKEKIVIDGEQCANINIANINMSLDDDYGNQTSYILHYYLIFSLLCLHYVSVMIKKL